MSGLWPGQGDGGYERPRVAGAGDSTAAGTAPASIAGQAVDYGRFRAVPELIEEQARRDPGRLAVRFGSTALRYGELDELANGVAALAAARGVRKGDRVAVLLANSLEQPAAYLGLMKLGAVFVPLDPAWPAERLATTLRVLSPRLILSAAGDPAPAALAGRAAVVSVAGTPPSRRSPAVPLGPDDLVYGFFTSGTTGTPKCAMNRHAGLSNRLRFMTRYFAATGDDVVLQNSRHTFDSSLWQLFWPLITGGTAVLPPSGEFLNLQRTIEMIADYKITTTDFVSSIFNVLVAIVDADERARRKLASLRSLIIGSEEINAPAVHRFRALLPHVAVTNGYGPTETSIGMVFHPVSDADGDVIPLGTPIDNCYVAVLGEDGRPVPRGASGEIAIGGACIGDGYHGDPAATAKAFIANQFPDQIPGGRLYLSGDLGHLDGAGRLFFSGRKDFQVKIGGVRIELGEIELAAHRCPGVRQAKALVADRAAGKSLAIFVTGDHGLTQEALRDHLRRTLPRTSLPRHRFVLPEMPVGEVGKVDWRALRALLDAALDADAARLVEAALPVTLPGRVLRAFATALGQPGLGADDNFLDAGGDSIQALAVVRELSGDAPGGLGVEDLLAQPTARGLAGLIQSRQAGRESGPARATLSDAALAERDTAIRSRPRIRAADPVREVRAILVTGATGFVGSRLVHELLTRTDLRVRCLARAPDDSRAAERVAAALARQGLWETRFADRIEGFAGDLAQPRLGLAARTWAHLARTCDLVLHNGALVNFLFDYRAHRGANVTGTATLLNLAMAYRPVPLHYISTLAALQGEAALRAGQLPEQFDPDAAAAPGSGYGRSKWVAERYLAEARRRGAVITVLRLGEVMPSADHTSPNPAALTHLLLSAICRLGVWPDASIRSDYSPVDYVAARIVAAVADRAAWGRALHVFHPESVSFAEALPLAGAPVTRVTCGEFLARLAQAARDLGHVDLVRLAALLPSQPDPDEATLRRQLRGLLTDNPALFRKDECARLEQRWGLADTALNGPIAAYRAYLAGAGR